MTDGLCASAERSMKLLDLIDPASIIAELKSNERGGAVRELIDALVAAGWLSEPTADALARSIVSRERARGTTAFGKGVAAPHAKVEGLVRAVCAVGRSSRGIDFSALDGAPVHIVFLVLSPKDQAEEHLKVMELVYRSLQDEMFRRFLRQCKSAERIIELLREMDEKGAMS